MSFRNQVIFWSITLVVLTLLFGQSPGGLAEAFYFVCMLMPVAVGTSWYFNDILVPRYLMERRYTRFILYFVYSMVISLWAQMFLIIIAYIILANFHLDSLHREMMNIRLLALVVYAIVFLQAFINMYLKFISASRTAEQLREESEKAAAGYLTVVADRKQRRIEYCDIVYVESLSDYVRFVLLSSEPVVTRETISKLEKRLPATFLRIHRSFIINTEKITTFSREEVILGEYALPVGRKYKPAFIEKME